jgi:transcriptional regulator with PAS, ATPase and Fis domain
MLSLVFRHTSTNVPHRRGVPEGEALLGRTEDNEIAVAFDENVSRRHARVTRVAEGVRLDDLGSKNGILQAGVRVQSVLLRPGDAPVQIGASFVTIEEAETGDLLAAFPVEREGSPERTRATLPVEHDREPVARGLGGVVRRSPQMQWVITQALAFARRPRPVLLLGETGTGKEVVARVIHDNGPHAAGPFVAVNCATMTRELIASELFGIEDGVATGVRARRGLFAEAKGGTLFLDEIGDIDADMQGTLLRAIQEREIRAAGMRRARNVRLRVILATNREERLRRDLVFRCSRIDLPPLRERPEDVRELTQRFLESNAVAISRTAVALLEAQPWPGNVRELLRVLEDAVALFGDGGMLHAEHLASLLHVIADVPTIRARHAALTRDAVAVALREHGNNKSAAARALGMSRSGIRKAAKRL